METYGHDFEPVEARVRRLRACGCRSTASPCCASTMPTCARSCRQIAKPMVTYGLAEDAQPSRHRRRERGGPDAFRRAARRRVRPVASSSTSPGVPQRAQCARRDRDRSRGRRRGSRRSRRRSRSSAAWAAASSAAAMSRFDGGGTFTLIDDYGHHPIGDGGDDRRRCAGAFRASARARVPAASLHAHTRPVRGLRAGAVDRRRARADRRLSRRASRRSSRRDGRALARAVRVAGQVEPVFVENARGRRWRRSAQSCATGDVVVTMGAGSIGQVPSQLAA